MLDALIRTFSNPIVLFSVGVPTVIAVYQFVDARRRAPLEHQKLRSEIRQADSVTLASEAQQAANITQTVNLMMGIVNDMRDDLKREIAAVTERQNMQIHAWLSDIERRISNLEAR